MNMSTCPECRKSTMGCCELHSKVSSSTVTMVPIQPRGWQCPRCERCFAPHVNECPHCQPGEFTTFTLEFLEEGRG